MAAAIIVMIWGTAPMLLCALSSTTIYVAGQTKSSHRKLDSCYTEQPEVLVCKHPCMHNMMHFLSHMMQFSSPRLLYNVMNLTMTRSRSALCGQVLQRTPCCTGTQQDGVAIALVRCLSGVWQGSESITNQLTEPAHCVSHD